MKIQIILTRMILSAICAFIMIALSTTAALTQSEKSGDKNPKPKDAPTAAGPALKQSVIAGGGGVSSAGNYRLEGTAGQPTTDFSSNSPFALRSGFWPGAIPCPFVLTETSRLYNSGGGHSAVKVVATGDCSWTASVSAPWVVLTSAPSGTGTDVIAYEVRENFTGAARQATITVGDYTNRIVQDANLPPASCGFAISPAFGTFATAGGASSISVTAAAACAWDAESDAEWVTITSGKVGIGSGAVTFAVAPAAPGVQRNATIRVAGKTYNVKQK
ncbi:MAG TPA: BACON domain-containing carbohydrate-binding protein [Blastocatellia bacterium]|nr:BACON domain-containing carbohydrate-binding protein [Blastocatellia bacterium]